MPWMACSDCRIVHHSEYLPAGDEVVVSNPECPVCGNRCEDSGFVYHTAPEVRRISDVAAQRLEQLNLTKAHVVAISRHVAELNQLFTHQGATDVSCTDPTD